MRVEERGIKLLLCYRIDYLGITSLYLYNILEINTGFDVFKGQSGCLLYFPTYIKEYSPSGSRFHTQIFIDIFSNIEVLVERQQQSCFL